MVRFFTAPANQWQMHWWTHVTHQVAWPQNHFASPTWWLALNATQHMLPVLHSIHATHHMSGHRITLAITVKQTLTAIFLSDSVEMPSESWGKVLVKYNFFQNLRKYFLVTVMLQLRAWIFAILMCSLHTAC